MKRILIAIAITLTLIAPVFGARSVAGKPAPKGSCPMMQGNGAACPMNHAVAKGGKSWSGVCPVTGAKIPDIRKAPKSVYKGKTYYFCCSQCKKTFDANPAKYAKPHRTTTSAVCPVMGTRIADVSKAAGKSVYKGKTYYFCCPSCKPKFDANPGKYVHSK